MIEIVPMTMEDIDEVMMIESENFTDSWSYEIFKQIVNNSHNTHPFVLKNQKCILGCLILYIVLDECEIHNLSIGKKYQRQGYGELLINFTFKYCHQNGIKRIFLEVREFNMPAISLYEKMGFRKSHVIEAYYKKPTENGILMSYDMEKYNEKSNDFSNRNIMR